MRRFLLAFVLFLAACSRNQPAGAKIDPALITMVPQDTVLLVGTRLESLLKTSVYQKFFANRSFSQIDEFAKQTKIDPRTELWELLFVSNGNLGVLLGRGKFSDQLEDPRAAKSNPDQTVYKGLTIVGKDPTALLFVNTSTAAVGTVADLRSLVDQRGKTNGPPPALAALIKDLPKEAQFWAAYTGGSIHLPFDANTNLGNLNKLIASVQSGSVYFDLTNGLHGVADGTCSDELGAQQVQSAIKALIGLGRLSVRPDQQDLNQVYDSIRVTQESRRVRLYIDVPETLVDKFLGVWLAPARR